MKRSFLTLAVLLLFIMSSVVRVDLVQALATKLYVDPVNTIDNALQLETPKTIGPTADGTFTQWTRNTTTLRPNGEGTFNDPKNWTGRILTLDPNEHGTSPPASQWSSWTHLTPDRDGIWANWTNNFAAVDDWPSSDGDSSFIWTNKNNYNESVDFWSPPSAPRALSIVKVKLTVVARLASGSAQMRIMLIIGGAMYNGSLVTPTASYVTYLNEWSTNPATGLPWTWTEMDAFQAGVRSQGTGELRVTQMYVSILTNGVYTDLDDWPDNNGDTDYIFAAADAKVQTVGLPDHTAETWNIQSVRVTIFAKQNVTSADAEQITIVLRIGATTYAAALSFTPTTAYAEYTSEWLTSPATSLAWTWSEIDSLEAGVKTTRVGSKWTGEMRVTQLYVKVIEPGTYAHWSEASQDGDATYVSAISGARVRSSTLQDHTSEGWSIERVQVSIVARTDVSTDERIQILLVVGGSVYYSSNLVPTTTYSTYSYVWAKNPKTNLAWDWTAIDGLEAGVKSVQYGTAWKGEVRVTQLYVVVGGPGTYAEWDEATQDGDASYVSATMKDMKESSVLEDPVHPTWDISRVRVLIYARATVATDEQVQPMVVVGGVEYVGKAFTLTTNYALYFSDWGKNPFNGLRWAWSDIDELGAGVVSVMGADKIWTGEIRVTRIYVEISRLGFSVDIPVGDVIDLYAFDFRLNYTTTVLTATTILNGSFFGSSYQVWQEDINDTLGSVRYLVTQPLGVQQGVNGSGVLATIDFTVDSYGTSVLDLCRVELLDSHGVLITPVSVFDGYFDNRIPGDITGPENPPGSGQYPSDRNVDGLDLHYLGEEFGTSDPTADFTGPENPGGSGTYPADGKVDILDLHRLGKNFGSSQP